MVCHRLPLLHGDVGPDSWASESSVGVFRPNHHVSAAGSGGPSKISVGCEFSFGGLSLDALGGVPGVGAILVLHTEDGVSGDG